MKLGLIDSGLGGISILKTLIDHRENLDVLCLADQKNVPYGNKASDEIIDLTLKNIEWFKQRNINNILLACNTTSAVAWPAVLQTYHQLNMLSIIDLMVELLSGKSPSSILVLATAATVKSDVYPAKIRELCPSTKIYQKALPELAGLLEREIPKDRLVNYLKDNLKEYVTKVEAVILGCTHYYLLRQEIQNLLSGELYTANQAILQLPFDFGNSRDYEVFSSAQPKILQKKIKRIYDLDLEVELAEI